MNRRDLLKRSTVFFGAGLLATQGKAAVPAGRDAFDYEVVKTEEEWRAQLSESDYTILREGKTEKPRSSELWNEESEGTYSCKGCALPIYGSDTKVVMNKGWLFFTAGVGNALLMSQDGPAVMAESPDPYGIHIEVHCRRCGCHIGHILPVAGKALHCVNGASLDFSPS